MRTLLSTLVVLVVSSGVLVAQTGDERAEAIRERLKGTDWIELFAAEGGGGTLAMVFSAHLKRHEQTGKDEFIAWVRTDHSPSESLNDKPFDYLVQKIRWDCKGQRMMPEQGHFYTYSGTSVGSYDSEKWQDVIPDTNGERMLDRVCSAMRVVYGGKKKD